MMIPLKSYASAQSSTYFSRIQCTLGEGPIWDSIGRQLVWVDILVGHVYGQRIDESEPRTLYQDNPPTSAVIPCQGGGWIVAGRDRLRRLDASWRPIGQPLMLPVPDGLRLNDAKVDPIGNLWIGSMDPDLNSRGGVLWCLDKAGRVSTMVDGIGISNTLAWDFSRRRFYFGDSARQSIFCFDWLCSEVSPLLANCRVHLPAGAAPGVPDGSAIDDNGHLFNARWDGHCVIRIDPAGKVVATYSVPVKRPTSCAFGGEDGALLFVTSASFGVELAGESGDGSVLSLPHRSAAKIVPAYAGGLPFTDFGWRESTAITLK